MREDDEPWTAHISAVAALDEPTRRRLYDFVVRQAAPVSRDEASDAVQVPRTTTAFHLDRLVSEGLLEAVYERRTGRSGPGAGRPSKLYRRSPERIAVSLPDRRYELAARLLADAVQEAETSARSPRTVLDRRAREIGKELGQKARAAHAGQDGHTATMRTLETFGFEPRAADTSIVLGNCPFHSLARQHTELVCGMNVRLLDGLLDGLATTGMTAHLDPAPGRCCVRLKPAEPGQARSVG
ncbi:helix-turn-helix transcriptional regulator [Nonomuraea lactucae]|uniref:helix-turn-helix transcriptional regulator n=1 Tax=Nonomuraea lactucae TaxID=2249762 RepID=UPI000DE289C8|nr:helix-turn-helix domain-containing protein [Nonomuraea lactucae]